MFSACSGSGGKAGAGGRGEGAARGGRREDRHRRPARPHRGGVRRGGRLRWRRRALASHRGCLRPLRAGPDASGSERLPDLRGAPRSGGLDADPGAHRQGRRARRGGGARHGGGRLPHEAVLVPGAHRPHPGAAPPNRRARPCACRRRRPADRPRGSARRGGARPRSSSPLASSTCSSSSCDGPGQALSKAEILAGVWDYDFDGDPNIVEVYIGRLRRKIDEPFGEHSIETVRGAGYRMAKP